MIEGRQRETERGKKERKKERTDRERMHFKNFCPPASPALLLEKDGAKKLRGGIAQQDSRSETAQGNCAKSLCKEMSQGVGEEAHLALL